MLVFEVEGGTEPGGAITAWTLVNTLALKFKRQCVADRRRLARERQESSHAAHFVHKSWIFVLNLEQSALKVSSSFGCHFLQLVLLDDCVLNSGELCTDGISKEGVKLAEALLHFCVVSMVEAA